MVVSDNSKKLIARVLISLAGTSVSVTALLWAFTCTERVACLNSQYGLVLFVVFELLVVFGTALCSSYVPDYLWQDSRETEDFKMSVFALCFLLAALVIFLYNPVFN